MKVKDCPYCTDRMYIYMKQERWICAEIAAAVNVYSKRVRREVTAQTGNVAPAIEI